MRRPTPLQAIVGLGFVGAGTLHFTNTRAYERIMPGYVPLHREAVFVSGAAEIVGGLGVLAPSTRPAARWWLVALLIAVFPANLEMALHPKRFGIAPALLWLRLPLQALAIAAVWRATEVPRGRWERLRRA